MKASSAQMVLDCLRRAVQPEDPGLTDGQLLRVYASRRDETAFTTLVRRHGPMVLAVCRRMIHHAEDAEDAFQATFVILARKGHRIHGRQTIGGWLHGVAYRVALDVRRRVAQRQAKEHQVEDMPHPTVLPEETSRDLLALLDRELARLPDKYRLPVVLCELEGRSRKEAALQLGLPEGTLSSRLATARKTLARRMAGYGAAVTAGTLEVLFASEACAACVPASLLSSTIQAASGTIPASVAALTEGVLKAMLLAKLKPTAMAFLVATCLSVGAVTLTYGAGNEPGPKATPSATAKADKYDLEALRLEVEALRLSLQATRERVKTLEADVVAQKAIESNRKKATLIHPTQDYQFYYNGALLDADDRTGKVRTWGLPSLSGERHRLKEAKLLPDDTVRFWQEAVIVPADAAKAEAALREAAVKVLLEPSNEKARESLTRALELMNRQAKPKPANALKP